MPTHVIFTTGISSSELLGSPSIPIVPDGITSSEGIGVPNLGGYPYPTGIGTGEAIGSPFIPAFVIYEYHIASAEAFGSPTLTAGTLTLYPISLVTFPPFGVPTLFPGTLTIYPTGIASAGAYGSPSLASEIHPIGISSSEGIGSVTLIPGTLTVPITGVASSETFGSPTVTIISNSLEYLPIYKQGKEFFQMISMLVDYVRTKDYLNWTYQDDPTLLDAVKEIIPTYHDAEAILAYYKFMLKPIIGTRAVMNYLIQLIDFDEQKVLEWFEYAGNVWHFKVYLGRVARPITDFGATYDAMYNLITDYKNERSYLEHLHIYIVIYTDMPFCGAFVLCGEDITVYDWTLV